MTLWKNLFFTVNQSDKRARVPIVARKEIFNRIVEMGKNIADPLMKISKKKLRREKQRLKTDSPA